MLVLLLLTLLCGLAVGLARGGTLDALSRVYIARPPLFLGALAVLAIGRLIGPLHGPAWALASIALVAFALANRRLPGLPLLCAGVILNAVVIGANHGNMPVSAWAADRADVPIEEIESSRFHEVAGADTTLRPLGDVLPLPLPGATAVVSFGDVLIAAGLGLFGGAAPVRARRTLQGRVTGLGRPRRPETAPEPSSADGTGPQDTDDDRAEPSHVTLVGAAVASPAAAGAWREGGFGQDRPDGQSRPAGPWGADQDDDLEPEVPGPRGSALGGSGSGGADLDGPPRDGQALADPGWDDLPPENSDLDGPDPAGSERDVDASERSASNRTGSDRAGSDRAGAEPVGVERTGVEPAGVERAGAERGAAGAAEPGHGPEFGDPATALGGATGPDGTAHAAGGTGGDGDTESTDAGRGGGARPGSGRGSDAAWSGD